MALFVVIPLACALVGYVAGHLVQASRTDRLLASMTPDEIRTLGARVAARRALKRGGDGG
jgi:hypothetical protein